MNQKFGNCKKFNSINYKKKRLIIWLIKLSYFVYAFNTKLESKNLQIIGDKKATYTTLAGNKGPNEIIYAWAALPFYEQRFYYATLSLQEGFYTVTSEGLYTISVLGQKQNAGYGYVAAYNGM